MWLNKLQFMPNAYLILNLSKVIRRFYNFWDFNEKYLINEKIKTQA